MAERHAFDGALVDQTLTGGLWIGDSSFKSAIYLRNNLKTDKLTITPVLYLGDGTRYALTPVKLAPEATEIVDINQALIAHNITPSPAITGYVELQYQWHWAALCAFIRNVDVAHSVIFTSPLSSPPAPPTTAQKAAAPVTHSVEGMWWKQEKNVSAFVALSNVTGNAIHATLAVDSQSAPLASHTVLLKPHTTATVDIADLPLTVGSSGSVHVSYDGPEGGLAVNGGLEDLQSGYSVNLPFVPVVAPAADAKPVTGSVAQLNLMSGGQTSEMHLPADTVFSPFSMAHNLSNAPLTITPEIWWMADSVPKSAMLPAVTLAAHSTQSLDPAGLLKAARLYNFHGGFNLVLHTSGSPNALLLAGGSVDATNNYVFSLAPHSVSESAAKSLSYWSTANGDDTMVTLWNPADEEQALVFRLTYPGGHYLLPVDLGAGATQNLDIAEIIRNQKPDAEGNIIPAGIHSGGAEVHGPQGEQERIFVTVDAGIYNAQKATCYQGCNSCSGYTGASILLASSPLFPAGASGSDQLTFMVQYNSGYQYDRTSQSNWSSSDTTVATVSNGLAQVVDIGNANISVTSVVADPVYVQICNAYFPGCPIAYTTPSSGGPVYVGPGLRCSAAVRGGTALCRAGGQGTFTNWTFTDGTNIVTSSNGSSATTWTGTVVSGGSVSVHNKGTDGTTRTVTAILTVVPRNWHTVAANPAEVPNGTFISLPVPPSSPGIDSGLGYSSEKSTFGGTVAPTVISDGGPNNGYVFLSAQPSITTLFQYEINPDLENRGSVFFAHQTGTYPANSNGTILGSVLLDQTKRHEYNHPTQSHWGNWSNAVSRNNVGDGLESLVLGPGSSQSSYNQTAQQLYQNAFNQWDAAEAKEPFAVNQDATGAPLGNICYSPYTSCQ